MDFASHPKGLPNETKETIVEKNDGIPNPYSLTLREARIQLNIQRKMKNNENRQ